MSSLSSLGVIHTAISLVAVVSGLVALAQERGIGISNRAGLTFVVTTVLTCVTGFGIFQHGGFGKPHALGIVTLFILAIAIVAELRSDLSRVSRYVATISYSTTLFLHFIPGVTETFTRLPLGAPLFSSPDDPALQKVIGALFAVYLVGVIIQVRQIHREGQPKLRRVAAA
jgi:uncharacterized membrane protein